jgi:hypothetical protein
MTLSPDCLPANFYVSLALNMGLQNYDNAMAESFFATLKPETVQGSFGRLSAIGNLGLVRFYEAGRVHSYLSH